MHNPVGVESRSLGSHLYSVSAAMARLARPYVSTEQTIVLRIVGVDSTKESLISLEKIFKTLTLALKFKMFLLRLGS